jgi:DNA ligase-1
MFNLWAELDENERYILNKLLTGAFRVGVSQQLVIKAIAQYAQLEPAIIAHRLMGNWQPTAEFFEALIQADTKNSDYSHPYPFYLAHPLQDEPDLLGDISQWLAEWKWDGIRGQIIKRHNQIFIWSRGEELVTERYPELIVAANRLPDGTVLDGEILCWKNNKVQPFSLLQQRIGRKTASKKMLSDLPVILMAYDLLELDNKDTRSLPFIKRRTLLADLLATINSNNVEEDGWQQKLLLSPNLETTSWIDLKHKRETARQLNVEGIMLKRLNSTYKVGRQRGDWWKWKVNPFTIDAVLIYAQPGNGKRANLYTDYTFGIWHNDTLVPIAKAYSGLTDEEIRQVDQYIRKNTIEKFGPVRTVKPNLVFELAFEAIQISKRHKSGLAVRFPRISRWRQESLPRRQTLLNK